MEKGTLGKILGAEKLPNDLCIEFYDQCRAIAGDRFFVQLLIRIPIPLRDAYFCDLSDPIPQVRHFLSEMGEDFAFEQTKSRNFVSTQDVPGLLNSMKEEFLDANRVYLGHPSFAKRFVLKQYDAWKKSTSWQQAHRKLVAEVEQKERESE